VRLIDAVSDAPVPFEVDWVGYMWRLQASTFRMKDNWMLPTFGGVFG